MIKNRNGMEINADLLVIKPTGEKKLYYSRKIGRRSRFWKNFLIGLQVPTEHMQNIFRNYDSYIRQIEDDLQGRDHRSKWRSENCR